MTAPLRPPAGTGAAAFFEQWLPEMFAATGRTGLPGGPIVRVTLSGANGGQWQLRAGADGLAVTVMEPRTARAPDPDVWLRQSAADFLATFEGDPDLPSLLPPRWSVMDLLFQGERDVELMRQIDGRIAIEILGRRRRRWALDLGFNKAGVSAGRPRATVRIDAVTFDGLRDGTLAPMQALITKKVQIEGDTALAMKALMLTGARLSR